MRTIKFRVWDKNRSEMSDWEQILESDDGLEWLLLGKSTIAMQYTGLKDKNGREIYEGDLLSWQKYSKLERKCVVEWMLGGWYIAPQLVPRRLFTTHKDCEVIGNIYENPELLRTSEEE